jgi:hypothetical protein
VVASPPSSAARRGVSSDIAVESKLERKAS